MPARDGFQGKGGRKHKQVALFPVQEAVEHGKPALYTLTIGKLFALARIKHLTDCLVLFLFLRTQNLPRLRQTTSISLKIVCGTGFCGIYCVVAVGLRDVVVFLSGVFY